MPFQDLALPSFPTDALPDWLRDFVRAEAVATQTPPDLAAMLALSCCALALANRAEVSVRPGWIEPLNLWTLVLHPLGPRPAQLLRDLTAPIAAYERSEAEHVASRIRSRTARRAVAARRLHLLRARAARLLPEERGRVMLEIDEEMRDLERLRIPAAPCLLADDGSPDHLASLLADQDGRIALLSAGLGPLERIAGPARELALKAYAGETLSVPDGRHRKTVRDPALTLGLVVPPDHLAARGASCPPIRNPKSAIRNRSGFLARFLFAVPPDLAGGRDAEAPPVPEPVRDAYREGLTPLLELTVLDDSGDYLGRYRLPFEEGASRLFVAFAAALEPRLSPEGDLARLAGWADHLPGAVARLAGVLHFADHAPALEHTPASIPPGCMERALRIGDYAIPHAQAAFAALDPDPVAADARRILAWIRRHRAPTFTKRDCFQAFHGRFRCVPAMEPALRLLEEHRYLREQSPPATRERGRQSQIFEVNPFAHRLQ